MNVVQNVKMYASDGTYENGDLVMMPDGNLVRYFEMPDVVNDDPDANERMVEANVVQCESEEVTDSEQPGQR